MVEPTQAPLPGSIPLPPPKSGRPGLVSIPPCTLWRVHPFDPSTGRWVATAFNSAGAGNARFSPLPEGDGFVPTLYAASTLEGALMETVFHDVPWPSTGYSLDLTKHLESSYCASQVELTSAAQLIDLTSVGLRAIGLRAVDLLDTNATEYPRARAWAQWLRQTAPTAQGLTWMSRQDNTCRALVFFGDKLPASSLVPGKHVHVPLHKPEPLEAILSLAERLQVSVGGL